jgi:hypothetical protein
MGVTLNFFLYHRWFSAATVMKYSAEFIGITEERNQSYGDASADWKTPVRFVPLPLFLSGCGDRMDVK